MKLTALALLAAILLATVPQAFAGELETKAFEPKENEYIYPPVRVEQPVQTNPAIVPVQPEPTDLEHDLRAE